MKHPAGETSIVEQAHYHMRGLNSADHRDAIRFQCKPVAENFDSGFIREALLNPQASLITEHTVSLRREEGLARDKHDQAADSRCNPPERLCPAHGIPGFCARGWRPA